MPSSTSGRWAPSALLRASALAPASRSTFGRARRCVLLFLTGGPPHIDTFDPKPSAPSSIRGELRPIATRVPGVRISDLFPRLAARADQLCIVRSVTHSDRTHTSAGYTRLTGVPPDLEITDRAGRPLRACRGTPIAGALT